MTEPTDLERLAIALHDLLWENVGVSDEWRLHMEGDDEVVSRFLELLNELQAAIKASGFQRQKYHWRDRVS